MLRSNTVLTLSTVVCLLSPCWAAEPPEGTKRSPDDKQSDTSHELPANRLAHETSPYLLLHAHNPVDWYPWGPEAFVKAQRENKPIFLSIGYSSCYWCHVMERESFTDEEIAEYLNEHFVSIKVDREERPDVDDIYMLALQVYHQMIGSSQGGGWPLSMFLTPEGKPMAGGTYFPPRPQRGMPGFLSVIQQIEQTWSTRQEQMVAAADAISDQVRRLSAPGAVVEDVSLDESLVDGAIKAVKEQYDPEYGGLDFIPARPVGPKFPVPTRLMFLQTQIDQADDLQVAEMVENTLDHMLRGGIRDHLGGGFHRYSTDRQWIVPHFEKMLYDNAQLAEVYVDAFARTGRQRYRVVAEETFAFVLRDMTGPEGGFYSALDAETDGIEGKHYVWSKEQIVRILGDSDARLFNAVYGLEEESQFQHGHVLHLPQPIAEAAEAHDLTEDELRGRLAAMREKLLAARQERPELLKDDKILTSWNGLMIRTLARGGETLDRPDLIEAAQRAARFILTEMRDEEGRLLRTHRTQLSKLNAYLDDYAFLVDGLLALHRVTGRSEWLNAARRLTDDQIDLFWDEKGHAFFFTSDHHEDLLARTKNAYDSVLPSGNSVSVRNLLRLAELTGNAEYLQRARGTLEVFAPRLRQQPGSMTFMALALDEYLASPASTTGGQDTKSSSETAAAAADGDKDEATTVVQANKFAQRASQASEDEPLILAGRTDPRLRDAKVSAKAYLSVDQLPPGKKAQLAVVISVKEGWHINANPARPDFLIPTELKLKAAQETSLSDATYPKGHDFQMEGFDEPLSVYEEEVLLTGTVQAPEAAAGKSEQIEVTVHYQACNDRQCLRPTDAKLTFRVPVATSHADINQINQRLFERLGSDP